MSLARFWGRPHRGYVCANLTGTLTYKSGIPIAMTNDGTVPSSAMLLAFPL